MLGVSYCRGRKGRWLRSRGNRKCHSGDKSLFDFRRAFARDAAKAYQEHYELSDDEIAGAILSIAARIARAAKRAFSADGITLRQNNDAASDQHLFHFHLHVIPRFEGDADRFNSTPDISSREEQEQAATKFWTALPTLT